MESKKLDSLLKMLMEDSEPIRRDIEQIIRDQEKKARKKLEKLYPQLSDNAQDWARHMFSFWDNMHPSMRKLQIKNRQEAETYSAKHIELYCTRQMQWLPQRIYSRLPWSDGTNFVPRHVIRYILGEYMSLIQPVRLYACDQIAAFLNQKEWQKVLEALYQYWLNEGMEISRKSIMVPYCLYIDELKTAAFRLTIRKWIQEAYNDYACFAIELMGVKASPVSLTILEEWIELTPETIYRQKAREAFRRAAALQNISVNELADRIIPSFGLDREGKRIIDYGSRTFQVTLAPDLTISVYNFANQKVKKTLPVAKDENEREKAEKARNEFYDFNKIIRTHTYIQRKRLEQELRNGYTRRAKAWQSVFQDNPVMRYMTDGLIWGTYRDGLLQTSFRTTQEGTLITVDKAPFTLPGNAGIALVHPIDLDKDTLLHWQIQLQEEGIKPFLSQLFVPAHRLDNKEIQRDAITRFSGHMTTISDICNYDLTEIAFHTEGRNLYLKDRAMNVLIEITFIDHEEGPGLLDEISFYPLQEEEIDLKTAAQSIGEKLSLASLPPRFVSYVIELIRTVYSIK